MKTCILIALVLAPALPQESPKPAPAKAVITLKKTEFLQGESKRLIPLLYSGSVCYEVTLAANDSQKDLALDIDIFVKGKRVKSIPNRFGRVLSKDGKTTVFVAIADHPASTSKLVLTIMFISEGNNAKGTGTFRSVIDRDEYIKKEDLGYLEGSSSYSEMTGDKFISLAEGERTPVFGMFQTETNWWNDFDRTTKASAFAIVVNQRADKPKE